MRVATRYALCCGNNVSFDSAHCELTTDEKVSRIAHNVGDSTHLFSPFSAPFLPFLLPGAEGADRWRGPVAVKAIQLSMLFA